MKFAFNLKGRYLTAFDMTAEVLINIKRMSFRPWEKSSLVVWRDLTEK